MRVFRCAFAWAVVLILAGGAKGTLTEEQILLVVNGNSEVSAYVADMYREYYPGIPENQVIKLSGLPDCACASATAAHEIITRQQYESLIAQPLRDHLEATGLVNDIYCIVTTAGVPYRIEDDNPEYADVVKPAGSDASVVAAHYGQDLGLQEIARRFDMTEASVRSRLHRARARLRTVLADQAAEMAA